MRKRTMLNESSDFGRETPIRDVVPPSVPVHATVREAVKSLFPPTYWTAVLTELESFREHHNFGRSPVELERMQAALIELSGGDGSFIVARRYQDAEWWDPLVAFTSLRQPKPMDMLVKMLGQDATRYRALSLLEKKGTEAASATQQIVELFNANDQRLTSKALKTLAAIGPEARAAVPAIRQLLNDKDAWMRRRARAALNAIEFLC